MIVYAASTEEESIALIPIWVIIYKKFHTKVKDFKQGDALDHHYDPKKKIVIISVGDKSKKVLKEINKRKLEVDCLILLNPSPKWFFSKLVLVPKTVKKALCLYQTNTKPFGVPLAPIKPHFHNFDATKKGFTSKTIIGSDFCHSKIMEMLVHL